MITFHDNESFEDSDSNSGEDDGISRSSSMASEYNYVRYGIMGCGEIKRGI